MDFAEITIDDKALFDRHLEFYNPQVSELTFTNMYMWRGCHKFRYTEINNMLFVISVSTDSPAYAMMPIGDVSGERFIEAVSMLKEFFNKKGWILEFKRITENELTYFTNMPYTEIKLDRDNCDYLYLTDALVHLKGKKYDGKRNHINRFKRQYEYEYVVLDREHVCECRRIIDEWHADRECHSSDRCEKYASMELLSNYERLGCKGAMLKVNGSFEAFTVGEMLSSDTAVIHMEKANNRINGLYAMINQQFCEREWSRTRYINREQDLGLEGLRKAKLSYNPVMLVNKYSIIVK